MSNLVVFDGSNLLHRSFHALKNTDLRDVEGRPVWAVHGLLMSISSIYKKLNCTNMIVTFDAPGSSKRKKEMYEGYKATRPKSDGNVDIQLSLAFVILSSIGISTIADPNEEADDLIASITEQGKKMFESVYVVSNDRDCYQLIDSNVFVVKPNMEIWNYEKLYEKYELTPEEYVYLAALRGEESDNIKGIKGIGEKKGIKLIKSGVNFSDIENERKKITQEIGEKLSIEIIANKDLLAKNINIIKLNRSIQVEKVIENSKFQVNEEKLKDILFDYNLKSAYNSFMSA